MPVPALPAVGIDDMAAYLPALYLPIKDLAAARDLNYAKLNKGLGLNKMAILDTNEDAATLAANAVLDLIHKSDLDPRKIGRIYMGTESALDGAKPTATYMLDMLQDHFSHEYGPNCFLHCDVVDLTFACIGAVDALQNTLDWVRNGSDRIGIVVAADEAKYELGSEGEYTQGAGAVAMLVKQNPRLLVIADEPGVATRPAHDFYKPLRYVSKRELVEEVLRMLPEGAAKGVDVNQLVEHLGEGIDVKGVLDCNEARLCLHKATPIFDGPYSNDCYQARINEALMDYRNKNGVEAGDLMNNWKRLVFHLPYAYQARRMFAEIFMSEMKAVDKWTDFVVNHQLDVPCADTFENREAYMANCSEFLRQVTKTDVYREFVSDKIERGERASSDVGNLYAGSIFLALMSTLEADYREGNELANDHIGFFAYGSGSKSKVLTATVLPGWRDVVQDFHLTARLENRQAINYDTYEDLHRGRRTKAVSHRQEGAFFLADVHDVRDNLTEGIRHYGYRTGVMS